MLNALVRLVTFGRAGARARTLGGWTPGLRELLAGRSLRCGCLAGIYRTTLGETVAIVDDASPQCPQQHGVDQVLWRIGQGSPATAASFESLSEPGLTPRR